MAVAFGSDLAAIDDGTVLVLDGEQGVLSVDPAREELEEAQEAVRHGSRRRRALAGLRGLPSETLDGRRIMLLCNAASSAEIDAGLGAGAAGVGLLRTELAFLEAPRLARPSSSIVPRSNRCSPRSAAAWRRYARSTSAGTRRRPSSIRRRNEALR